MHKGTLLSILAISLATLLFFAPTILTGNFLDNADLTTEG